KYKLEFFLSRNFPSKYQRRPSSLPPLIKSTTTVRISTKRERERERERDREREREGIVEEKTTTNNTTQPHKSHCDDQATFKQTEVLVFEIDLYRMSVCSVAAQ
ncbi:MAG: hypothetical protein ACK4UV_12335, partial [Ignavibacterium sp.]